MSEKIPEQFVPLTTQASHLMIDAMKKLSKKEIDPKEASAIAQLGIGVVQAANAEIQFIRTAKGLPAQSMFGSHIMYLEPEDKPKIKGRV